eukprot:7316066-Heterocapsa_arctica.AAC.1
MTQNNNQRKKTEDTWFKQRKENNIKGILTHNIINMFTSMETTTGEKRLDIEIKEDTRTRRMNNTLESPVRRE